MTVIRLDAATLAKFQSATGQVVLADEAGKPVQVWHQKPIPVSEPELTADEWKRRASEPGGMTTPELLKFLRSLDTK